MKVVSTSPLQIPHKIFPPPTLYMPGVKEFQPKSKRHKQLSFVCECLLLFVKMLEYLLYCGLFSGNWGPMTGRELNWNHTNPETLEVAVTYEGDQWRRTAEDYINAIAKVIGIHFTISFTTKDSVSVSVFMF